MTDSSAPPQPAFGETTERRPTPGFGAAGLLVGLLAVLVVVGGLAGLAVAGRATPANHVDLFGGSIVLEDNRPLTVVNRATGEPTAQLEGVNTEVGASTYSSVEAVPFDGGTLLVNEATGTFNLLQPDNYVADRVGHGVGLGPLDGTTSAAGYAAGTDAYILRRGDRSTVSLVDAATVSEAATDAASGSRTPTKVAPVGYAELHGTVPVAAGSTAVAGGALWTLVEGDGRPCELVSVTPTPAKNGDLPVAVRDRLGSCPTAALATAGAGTVGLAVPGQVILYHQSRPARPSRPGAASDGRPARPTTVAVPALAHAERIMPVTGSSSRLWYLADGPSGWQVVGIDPATGTASVKPLHRMAGNANPAPPVISDGRIYTLPRQPRTPPSLLVIDPATGAVGTVEGERSYPLASRTEQDDFDGADVLVSGPRVVFNNPGSLLAVMVFTDGSRGPAVIAKSAAPAIAPTGPAQVSSNRPAPAPGKHGRGRTTRSRPGQSTTTPTTAPAPKPPAASTTVNCATTTEKPYQPTGLRASPAPESAGISWGYTLLTDADCEPQTWAVRLHALSGPQPQQPVQYVDGQQQLDVTGLRPSTRYRYTVTAYINHQSTTSAPSEFETAAQGADAPTGVTAHVTGTGSWVVDWTPCQGATCYTPAARWEVTGTACGGSYVGAAPSEQVAGSQDSATFDAASLGRLGQSLRFSVQGVSALGLPGNPVSESACLQSWRPPQRSAISLAASGRTVGSTVSATLSVAPALSDTGVFGSLRTSLQYQLNGKAVTAPTSRTTVVVPGLSPNTTYHPSVAVWPTDHPADRVVVDAPTVVKDDLQWSPSLTARLSVAADAGNPDVGTVTATFSGLAAGSYRTGGSLVCGSASNALHPTTFSGDTATFDGLDLVHNGGLCTADLSLDSTQHPDPYGTPTSLHGLTLQMPAPPSFSFAAGYRQNPCTYVSSSQQQCDDTVTVSPRAGQRLAGTDWQIVAYQGSPNSACSHTTTTAGVPSWPQVLTMGACGPTSTGAQVVVQISWLYLGQTGQAEVLPTGSSGAAPSTTTSTTTTTTTTVPKHHHPHPPPTTSPPSTHPKSSTTSSPTTKPSSPTTGGGSTTSSPDTTASGAAALTASRGPSGPTGPGGGAALDVLVGVVVLGIGGAFVADRRRRSPSRQPRGAQ